MSKKTLTKEEINQLMNNENIINCSEESLTYSKDFKIKAVKLYEQGLSPVDAFKQAGINPNVAGKERIRGCLKRWNNVYRANGEKGLLVENRGRFGGRTKKPRDGSDADKIKRLETEVAYLKAENDFLVKLRAKRRAE